MIFSSSLVRHQFVSALDQGIQKGRLRFVTPAGEVHFFGDLTADRAIEFQMHSWSVLSAILSRGDIGLGETYMEGLWDTNDLEGFYRLLIDNIDGIDRYASGHFFAKFFFNLINRFLRRNSLRGSVRNIRSHYDVGNEFYQLWLDETMTYSSALFEEKLLSLAEAQKNKYQRILGHLSSSPKNILEIGCGWGGFAEEALKAGHSLTGLTLSQKQFDFAKKRVPAATILLEDYRNAVGSFDAIVSIEMFEAVGMKYWKTYFKKIKQLLAKHGVAIIQTITLQEVLFENYSKTSDYIRHYVFPGGALPSLSRFKEEAEKAGLLCKEIYFFGQDYAQTLREWLHRFNAQEAAIRGMGYSDSFIRGWRLYLTMCAAGFASGRTDVIQVELVHA